MVDFILDLLGALLLGKWKAEHIIVAILLLALGAVGAIMVFVQ